MTPSGQVTWGQSISITCSLTTQYSGGYFDLEKTSSSFHLVQSARSASATFSMAEVTLDNEGVYRCRYLVRDSGSDIISPLSDPLTVSVTGKNIHLKVQNPELALSGTRVKSSWFHVVETWQLFPEVVWTVFISTMFCFFFLHDSDFKCSSSKCL
uniref:Immunoglobulin-like beta-sandwich domain-containing protein n=1 Tax=Sphaeramia orbicularis TaxID=375764 RepID=A0A672YB53_9TELE